MSDSRAYLLGYPVSHSLSPLMQNAAFAWAGFSGQYEALEVLPEHLETTLEHLEAESTVVGCNITVPHKLSVYRWLVANGRILQPAAGIFEAVNTLVRGPDGLWQGDSTDYEGFLHNLRRSLAEELEDQTFEEWIAEQDIAILGSGGSAQTLARGFASDTRFKPHGIDIFARSPQKATGMLPREQIHSLGKFPIWNRGRQSLVIQTTTVGMESGEGAGLSPVPVDAICPGQVACDIVYKPLETPFLAQARARGAITVSGLGMLVGQGAQSCQKWLAASGITKDIFPLMDTMERALGAPR
ncbi:MAG: shikimate dehydrogenase [Fibrobacterota bacterium]